MGLHEDRHRTTARLERTPNGERPRSGLRYLPLASCFGILLAREPTLARGQVASTCSETTRLTFGAELGYRVEEIVNEHFAETDATSRDDHRFRWRVRLRFGADYQLSERVSMGLRLSTGENNYPTTGWSTFNTDLRRTLFQVDRAFLLWRPRRELQLRFGIGANPLFTPTELVWDTDAQTAGFAQLVTISRAGLTLAAGQFMLREVRSTRPENQNNSFLLAQGISYLRALGVGRLRIGAGYYHFTNPNALARAVQTGELDGDFKTNRFDPGGRTTTGPGDPATTIPVDFFSDFRVVDFGLNAELNRVPLSLSAEVALNLGARRNALAGEAYEARGNLAAGGMLRYGRNQEAGDWLVGLGFFHIEADAVVAVFNSDDLQQTNVNSVPIELQLRFPRGVRLVWDTYMQKKVDTDLASNGGVVHSENAARVRTRLSLLASF